jgi:8-hydroxy-5-deazaflavin:NADPH oxidoreductase
MDTGNYYPQRDGHLAEPDTGALTSSGLLQVRPEFVPNGSW